MGATVTYKGSVIHEAEGGETFTLNTDGKYMDGNIVVEVDEDADIPSASGESF